MGTTTKTETNTYYGSDLMNGMVIKTTDQRYMVVRGEALVNFDGSAFKRDHTRTVLTLRPVDQYGNGILPDRAVTVDNDAEFRIIESVEYTRF